MVAATARDVQTLSGSERRRVAIAMLLAQDPGVMLLDEPTPGVMLLDEPTNHLDIAHEVRTFELLVRLSRERGRAVLMAVHDLTLAARYATHAVLLGCDKVEAGPAAQLLEAGRLSLLYGQALVAVAHPRGPAFLPA